MSTARNSQPVETDVVKELRETIFVLAIFSLISLIPFVWPSSVRLDILFAPLELFAAILLVLLAISFVALTRHPDGVVSTYLKTNGSDAFLLLYVFAIGLSATAMCFTFSWLFFNFELIPFLKEAPWWQVLLLGVSNTVVCPALFLYGLLRSELVPMGIGIGLVFVKVGFFIPLTL